MISGPTVAKTATECDSLLPGLGEVLVDPEVLADPSKNNRNKYSVQK